MRKTVKGYIALIRKIEINTIMCLKGYDELSQGRKNLLSEISASLGNLLGIWDDEDEAYIASEMICSEEENGKENSHNKKC